MMTGLIQVAGVHDAAEAQMLAAAGVDWLGIPLRLEVNQPDLEEDAAAALIAGLPAEITPVLITYEPSVEEILALAARLKVKHVQLHGPAGADTLDSLKRSAPQLKIIKSLLVGRFSETELRAQIAEMTPYADWFITDTFDPRTGAMGATGLRHDWAVSRRLADFSPLPVILAGGLNAENVAAGIRSVRPGGVDAHTGLEDAAGRKDEAKVRAFVTAARAAFATG